MTVDREGTGRVTRVMWMLNHETLRGAEVEFMRELGVEVFTPKVIPETGFRSADITFEYDASLSIPKEALDRLNAFDFFADAWPDEIQQLANEYFDIIMVMPLGQALPQALRHFKGPVVLRVFGTSADMTYARVLTLHYGLEILDLLADRAGDFVFGQAYANLSEVEPAFFRERTLTLPITLPRMPTLQLPPWNGRSQRLATLCPDITDVFSTRWYLKFLEEMGDLQHLILGNQDAFVRDPQVLGRVSWDRFGRELAASRVFFYMSREPRHVHYTPFEAAQVGSPVVFFDDSLFGDLCVGVEAGRVHTWAQARSLVEDLLAADIEEARSLHGEQGGIATALAWSNHVDEWRAAMGTLVAWKSQRPAGYSDVGDAFRVLSKERSTSETAPAPVGVQVHAFDARSEESPDWLASVLGVDEPESWGRWSTSDVVTLMLASPVSGLVRVSIQCMPFEENRGQDLIVGIGGASKKVAIGDAMSRSDVALRVDEPTDRIDIEFPVTAHLVGGQRHLGIAIEHIEVTVAAVPARFTQVSARVSEGAQ